jgi:cyclic pyranopterin phosphate synthase
MKTMITDKFGRPIRDLRLSVIDKCNFRCPYCMPAEIFGESYQFLHNSELLTVAEMTRLTHLFARLGVSKLRLTGGEPLIHPNLPELIHNLVQIPGIEDMAMTTNGFFLAEQAQAIKDAGLIRLTVSLDSLDNDVFQVMNGHKSSVDRVLAGFHQAEAVGFSPIKINCVVKRGVNDHTLVDLARYFQGTPHIVRFIEYMDVGNLNGWRMDDVVSGDEIIALIHRELPLEQMKPNYYGEVAKRFRYVNNGGEIGVVTSVTQPFCGDCTRARLSSAGEYYTCLFGTKGLDLKTPLRQGASDEALLEMMTGVWHKRTDRYSELRTSFTRLPRKGAEMYRLGG